MDIDHPYAHSRRRGASLRHGVRNVVKLEVEKNQKSATNQLAHQARLGRGEELLTNFYRAFSRIEPRRQTERRQHVGKVERNDDPRRVSAHVQLLIYAKPSGDSVRRGE